MSRGYVKKMLHTCYTSIFTNVPCLIERILHVLSFFLNLAGYLRLAIATTLSQTQRRRIHGRIRFTQSLPPNIKHPAASGGLIGDETAYLILRAIEGGVVQFKGMEWFMILFGFISLSGINYQLSG